MVHGKYNIIMSFGQRKNLRQPFCQAQADAPDAYFTFPVGCNPTPPVDDAPAHKNQWRNGEERHGSWQIQYHCEFWLMEEI